MSDDPAHWSTIIVSLLSYLGLVVLTLLRRLAGRRIRHMCCNFLSRFPRNNCTPGCHPRDSPGTSPSYSPFIFQTRACFHHSGNSLRELDQRLVTNCPSRIYVTAQSSSLLTARPVDCTIVRIAWTLYHNDPPF